MKNFNTLIGLDIRVFLDAHTVEGQLEHIDDEKLILNDKGSYIMIYKDKVNMVLLNPGENIEAQQDPNPVDEYYKNIEAVKAAQAAEKAEEEIKVKQDEKFLANGVAEDNQYGSILPKTLFEQQPIEPHLHDFTHEGPETDFSISASVLQNEQGLLSRAERQKIINETKRDIENGSTE